MKCKIIHRRQFIPVDPVNPLWGLGPKEFNPEENKIKLKDNWHKNMILKSKKSD